MQRDLSPVLSPSPPPPRTHLAVALVLEQQPGLVVRNHLSNGQRGGGGTVVNTSPNSTQSSRAGGA